MSNYSRAQLTPAWVLHSRPYSNTSLLVDFFTLQSGRVTCVAKGVRKKASRLTGILQPFIPLVINFSGRGAVKTLGKCETVERYETLHGEPLFAAYYLNELVLKALPVSEPHENLFAIYANILGELVRNEGLTEPLLRTFEIHLLSELGYGLQLELDAADGEPIESEAKYRYEYGNGPVKVLNNGQLENSVPVVSGESLLAMKNFSFTEQQHRSEAKKLMRYLINCLLGGYHFKSRDFFSNRYQRKT